MFNYNTWKDGELLAQKYLKKKGYKILETNSKLAGFEADIVASFSARKQIKELKELYKSGQINKTAFIATKKTVADIVVIVEVKARSSQNFGSPLEAVTYAKQQHIKNFAKAYIKLHGDVPIRFDVISIVGTDVEHITNAF